jgi:hypothetical protein
LLSLSEEFMVIVVVVVTRERDRRGGGGTEPRVSSGEDDCWPMTLRQVVMCVLRNVPWRGPRAATDSDP